MSLVDPHGRDHRDLRISLTDHCNLRCSYCMPAGGVPWLPRETLLSPEELMRIVRVAVAEGITEVRLTGGEPLLRPDCVAVVSAIASVTPRPEISITTNGIGLARMAAPLKAAGLSRVNVSLDTLKPDLFHTLTRRNRLADVLDGIAAADAAGLQPVKLNALQLRGVNDGEAPVLLAFAIEHGYELRFIEQMPLDAGHTWRRDKMVTAAETLASLQKHFELTPLPGRGAAPAERYLVDGGPGTVGIIASVTAPFCGNCDRLRLTADGQLRNCLFSQAETDLRSLLREGGSDDALVAAFHRCLADKLPGHGINDPDFLQPRRPMNAIGG